MATDAKFLQQYAETYRFRLGIPKSFTMIDKNRVLFLRAMHGRSFDHAIYSLNLFTKEETCILTAEQVLNGATVKVTEEEKARLERMREASKGIRSFELMAMNTLMVPLSGSLYLVELPKEQKEDVEVTRVPLPLERHVLDPSVTPDGSAILYVSKNNLYCYNLRSQKEFQLTNSTDANIVNGLPEFVAQEEMDRYSGYWCSSDSLRVIYQQNDATNVETFHIMDPTHPEQAAHVFPYPRPGKKNVSVRLFIANLSSLSSSNDQKDHVEIQWDRVKYEYVTKVIFHTRVTLLCVQNRAQTELVILRVNISTGETSIVHIERDDTWVNLDQQMPRVMGETFLWTTERNGGKQLELRRLSDGTLVQSITTPEMGYRSLLRLALDMKVLWFSGGPDATSQHAYKLTAETQELVQLTTNASINACGFQGTRAIVRTDTLHGTPTVSVVDVDTWKPVADVQVVAESPSFQLNAKIVTVESEHKMNGVIIRPVDFKQDVKYPVIVYVYGGPHHRTVSQSGSTYYFQQWLANHGFIVVQVDGRGTPFRGRAWERAIHRNFIQVPLADQIEGLQGLGAMFPEMDMTRVGVYGWSFGGYFSALAVMLAGDVYHAGFSGAPVAAWEDYDTHYTERYMSLPEDNADGYLDSMVMTHAHKLYRPLCIVHGTADDNVYFSHAIKMSDALFRANIDHEFLPLVDFTHMVTDPVVVNALYGKMLRFFFQNIKNGVRTISH